jgi:SSS family solute:Na+ symporter
MTTETTVFIGIAVYMLIMISVGLYASKKTHSVTEFMVAGRGMPLWLCSMTVIATWFGGAMMLGGAGAAYEDGMYGVIEDPWGGALALLLIGLFFARLFRRLRMLTVVDFMEQRFGKLASYGLVITTLFSNIVWVGAMLVAFGVVFESLTSIPLETGIIGGAIVIFIYTAVGGMWAVALTDFVQMLIIMLGLVILLVVVLIDVGGWGAISPQLPADTFRMIPFEHTGEHWLNY